jgi:DNA-binding MarR family transcriptional regulator
LVGDGRAVGARLTPGGRALFARADASRRAGLEGLFTDRLDEKDLADLVRVWRKLKTPAS